MRASGVVLLVLIFGHLFVNLMVGEGVKAIDFGFVGGKWADPFWQWLGPADALARADPRRQRHAHDHQRLHRARHDAEGCSRARCSPRRPCSIVLGTLVIFTFDPCPAGAPADLLPSFCPAV